MEIVPMVEILAGSDAPTRRFLVGDLVEVRMLGKGLRGSWHPGKVVEVHNGKRTVEYEELLEEDEKTKLRELIRVGRASDGDNLMGTLPLKSLPKKTRPVLRPRPPAHPNSQPISWQEGVWVECFYDDAWWEGILAENITSVNVEDVAQVTRKSEVDVLFPAENDVSKMSVNMMRIGQEWDEETGNWSLRGCAPVPVVRPNKKRSKKDSRQSQSEIKFEKQQLQASEVVAAGLSKETEVAKATNSAEPKTTQADIDSELCENALTVTTIINNFCQDVEDSVTPNNSRGYGYEERLNMFHLGGGSSKVSLNMGAQKPVDACPPTEEPPLEENEVYLNATDFDVPIEQVDDQSPVRSNVNISVENEEAAENFLVNTGWNIKKNIRKKTGEVIWTCKSPRVSGAAVKTFSSLVEALSFEAHRGPPGGSIEEAISLSQSSFADKKDGVKGSSADTGIGEAEDDNDDYAVSVRQILKRSGWEVFNGLRTGTGGKGAWLYRTPEAGSQPRKWFKNWRLAIEEYLKRNKIAPKQEANVRKEKKRAGRGQHVSPLPTPKRVTRRHSMSEDAKSTPEDTKKSADESGPSFVKSEDVPNSGLPVFSPRDDSDIDDNDKREVNIVVNSGRKRTGVDLGQNFTRFDSSSPTSPLVKLYLQKPFGSVSSFTQNDNAYVLQVTTHDFSKEQISIAVEKSDMLIKARYVLEEKLENIPIRCNGSVSARLTLPKNVERQMITAELKSPLLILTLPKSITMPEDVLDIKIQ